MGFIVLLLALIFNISYKIDVKPNVLKANSILSLPEYQDIREDNITKITMIRYTEAGDTAPVDYTTKEEINGIYNSFLNTIYLGETKSGCEDNTTTYTIYLNDGTSKKIVFECEVLVLNGKRLLIE